MRARVTLTGLAVLGTAGAALTLPAGAAGATNGRLAFQAFTGRFPQVFTIKPDGSGVKQITHVAAKDPGAEKPTWTPDGKTIAFDAAVRKGVNIFTTGADGGPVAELPLSVGAFNGDPAYSPDGTRISFDQDIGPRKPRVHGIFIANADGTDARRLTRSPATTEAFDTESRWSPDGSQIAFTRVRTPGKAAVFVVGIDGTGLKRLTPWRLDATSPSWSPDGSKIVFNSHDEFGPKVSANLFWIRPGGGRRHALTHNRGGRRQSFSACWSPDGTRIVFSRFILNGRQSHGDLYTIDPTGSARPPRLSARARSCWVSRSGRCRAPQAPADPRRPCRRMPVLAMRSSRLPLAHARSGRPARLGSCVRSERSSCSGSRWHRSK